MSGEEDLRRLEFFVNHWARRVLQLVDELRQAGVQIDVSVGIRSSDQHGGTRGEIIIRISPVDV